ncbi:MAG TPA: hypothetical protein VK174_06875 [Chitinophagales bacterium]|nr:hypothetical protein [Chitinophagales bacterium]
MNNNELKTVWRQTVPAVVTGNEVEWENIMAHYSDKGRHYHTMRHLANMYDELFAYYKGVPPVATTFALFYHDLVYSPLRSDNEQQSADYARKVLMQWNMPAELISKVHHLIVCTQSHEAIAADDETNVFLDADMAILGSAAPVYQDYTTAVRKEFSIYPDFIYNKGRRDFLRKTLSRPYMFLTAFFRAKYESHARINLQNELNQLL